MLRHIAAFECVPGVGQAKLTAYGVAVNKAIRRYADEHGILVSKGAAASTPSVFEGWGLSNQAVVQDLLA